MTGRDDPAGTDGAGATGGSPGLEGARVRSEVLGQVGVITLDDPRGAGMGVWSAGQDNNELPRGGRDPLTYNDPLERLLRAVRMFPAPALAMVHGSVSGGAFDLALSRDGLIADETATFAITPANLGLPSSTSGLLHFLGRLPINLTREMFFSAAPLDARRAKEWLVLNHRHLMRSGAQFPGLCSFTNGRNVARIEVARPRLPLGRTPNTKGSVL